MKRTMKTAVAAGVGGAILVGGVAAAVPAFAGNGPGPGPAASRPGRRLPRRRPGAGSGVRCDLANWPAGTLTSQQQATLASIAEQEKLSRDLFAAFAARYHIPVFTRIAAAETRHLDAIRTALAAYGVADPTAGKAAGTFATPAVQASYDRLLAQGTASQDAALRTGQAVERADITALSTALKGLTAPRLQNIYTNLLDASRTHLATSGTGSAGEWRLRRAIAVTGTRLLAPVTVIPGLPGRPAAMAERADLRRLLLHRAGNDSPGERERWTRARNRDLAAHMPAPWLDRHPRRVTAPAGQPSRGGRAAAYRAG